MNKLIKCINEFEVDNGIFFIDVIFGFVFYCEKRLKKELVNYWLIKNEEIIFMIWSGEN